MTYHVEPHGLALWCDHEGCVVEVLRDDFELGDAVGSGRPFRQLCDPLSRGKFDRLLAAVRRQRAVYDWTLNLQVRDEPRLVHVTAARSVDRVIIIGVENPAMSDSLYEELIRISGEQANALRVMLKELALHEREAARGNRARVADAGNDGPALEEFARLNNELMSVQRELAKRNIELERLSLDKDRFVGMAAHDLRQPLRAIISMTELLKVGSFGALVSEQVDIVDTIRASSQAMLELVNDLLDVSVIESGKLELRCAATDLIGLIGSVATTYRGVAVGKGIDIEVALALDMPARVWLDENRMGQVLGNLVSNALKYSHANTTVRIHAERVGDTLVIEIADQGQGIPEDELAWLFQPFARTSVKTTAGESSTGLGLAISERVVREHGGRISVTSRVGVGSTFRVEVPWREPEGSDS